MLAWDSAPGLGIARRTEKLSGQPLGTGRVKRCQLTAAHRHKLRREPAMPIDPSADFWRI